MIDYHVHTSLCNHANGTMEQYIRQAVEIGLTEICFLDHLILHEKGRRLTMSPEELPFYFHAARHLANKYKDQIQVKVGLEVDVIPAYLDQIVFRILPEAATRLTAFETGAILIAGEPPALDAIAWRARQSIRYLRRESWPGLVPARA